MTAASQSRDTEDQHSECPLFNIPPHLRIGRLDLKPAEEVLTADVMENLQPPPVDAAANSEAYYSHVAEIFQRLNADLSFGGIAAAQATADQLWRVLHPLPDARLGATVGERVAAARRVRHPEPPAEAAAAGRPTATPETQKREELISFILQQIGDGGCRSEGDVPPSPDTAPATAGSGGQDAVAPTEGAGVPAASGIPGVAAAKVQEAPRDAAPEVAAAPIAPDVAEVYSQEAEPPSSMAEFIVRGDHGPRGQWLEPPAGQMTSRRRCGRRPSRAARASRSICRCSSATRTPASWAPSGSGRPIRISLTASGGRYGERGGPRRPTCRYTGEHRGARIATPQNYARRRRAGRCLARRSCHVGAVINVKPEGQSKT